MGSRREAGEAQQRAHELQVETLRLTQLAEQTRARSEQIAGDLAEVDAGLEVFVIGVIHEDGTVTGGSRYLDKTDQVELWVADTGKGIPEAELDKIFEPFFTTKAVGKGTGLGLSISYSIIEKLGGAMRVQSKVGEGTVFTITLPKN